MRWVQQEAMLLHPTTSAAHMIAQPDVRRVPTPHLEIFERPRFLSPELCAELIELIERDLRPSTIADDNGDTGFRTSQTCDLPPEEMAVQRLESLLTCVNSIDPAHGEPIQGQRYCVGQEFKAHTDYFEPTGPDFAKYCTVPGNRTWTFMIYLNAVESGGGTRFKQIGKTFKPETGKLLCWNNHAADGSLNPYALHQGMKVRKGVKYVITKWYREKIWGWE